jgi:hypothetical protein
MKKRQIENRRAEILKNSVETIIALIDVGSHEEVY